LIKRKKNSILSISKRCIGGSDHITEHRALVK
jgi:hypothetical protein